VYSFTPQPPVPRVVFAAALRAFPLPLLALVDQGGSMVPFALLVQEFLAGIESAAGALSSISYFHDSPAMLFGNPALSKACRMLGDVLPEVGRYRGVLLVSDAGAAQGHFERERVRQTGQALDLLRSTGIACVWLNPMPRHRWERTSAEDIAQMVPMYQLDADGMLAALVSLRDERKEGAR
jgi:uncharacterized protein